VVCVSEVRKCIIGLRRHCIVYDALVSDEKQKYGTKEFVITYCGMCIKTVYAKAKRKLVNKYSVVNTL
jgi:hypothetical protein